MQGRVPRGVLVWAAILLAVVVSLAGARAAGSPAVPQGEDAPGPLLEPGGTGVPVWVRIQASRGDAATVTYTLTIENGTDTDLGEVYIAGKVPQGTEFASAGAPPAGAWFRGYEGTGTPQQAAVWLADRIPARSTLGPFSYQVRVVGAVRTRGSAQGWVHWRAPVEGTAASLPVGVPGR